MLEYELVKTSNGQKVSDTFPLVSLKDGTNDGYVKIVFDYDGIQRTQEEFASSDHYW